MLQSCSYFTDKQVIHVRGYCGDKLVDIPLACQLVIEKEDVKSVYRLLYALFSHQRIQMLEHRIQSAQASEKTWQELSELVCLSEAHGVLSFYRHWSYAYMAEKQISRDHFAFPSAFHLFKYGRAHPTFDWPQRYIIRIDQQKQLQKQCGICSSFHKREIGRRLTDGRVRLEMEPRTILIQQNENGAWNAEIIRLVTKLWDVVPSIPVIEKLGELDQDAITSIKATVLAITLLRSYFGSRPVIFRVAERRGLAYLTKVSKTTDWQSSIQQLVSKYT